MVTMNATAPQPTYQPHPLDAPDAPDARGWYLWAEILTVAGHSAGLLLLLAGVTGNTSGPFLIAGGLAMIATTLTGSRMRRVAWERTPGAFGRRRWAAPRNPYRLVRPTGDALVLGGAGVWLLDANPWQMTELVVLGLAAYFIGGLVGSDLARRHLDVPVFMTRVSSLVLMIVLATAGTQADARPGALGLSALIGLLGLITSQIAAIRRT